MEIPKICLSVEEAAKAIGVSRKTMYDLIHMDGFPSIKLGGRRLISSELLAEWVKLQAGGSCKKPDA